MKLLKKLVIVLMLNVVIITMFGVGINKSNATDEYVVGEVELYSKSMLICMNYEDYNYPIDFVVYKEGDFEYPAYPLWKKSRCVVDVNKTKAEVDGIFKNAVVRNAILNGYPFRKPAELGCESEIEAYGATSIAINKILNGCDLEKFVAFDRKGERILNATKKILENVGDPNDLIPSGNLKISEVTKNWEFDGEYISKVYTTSANMDYETFNVILSNIKTDKIKVTNLDNEPMTIFKKGECFKISVPLSEIVSKEKKDIDLDIIATALFHTIPILYGKTEDKDFTDYALVNREWGEEYVLFNEQYPTNSTKIKIIIKDRETKEKLKGAKFNILSADKEVIYSNIETDENGYAEVFGINPGEYYVQEVEAPSGYSICDEMVKVDLKFNDEFTVNVDNYKKFKSEEKGVEEKETKENITDENEVEKNETGEKVAEEKGTEVKSVEKRNNTLHTSLINKSKKGVTLPRTGF